MPDHGVSAELQEPLPSEDGERLFPHLPFLGKEIEIPFDTKHKRKLFLSFVFHFVGDQDYAFCRIDPLGHTDGEAFSAQPDVAAPGQDGGTPLQGGSVFLVDEISLLAVIDSPEPFPGGLRMEKVVEERVARVPVVPQK